MRSFVRCCVVAVALAGGPARGESALPFADFVVPEMERDVHYFSTHAVEKGDDCRVATVIVHGWGDGVALPKEAPSFARAAAKLVGASGVPYIVAPVFPTRKTLARFNQPDDGRARWCDSLYDAKRADFCSPGDDWRGGGDAAGTKMSSFDVIDRIFSILGDKSKYPNLRRVVLTGFSAGGQFSGRYAAVGKGFVNGDVTVDYAPMSPSTWLRLDEGTVWLYGLKDRPRYSAALSRADILKNLSSRRQWNACGRRDVLKKPQTSLDMTPMGNAQGENRYARFQSFEEHVKTFPEWAARCSFRTFETLGHEYRKAFSDEALVKFLCAEETAAWIDAKDAPVFEGKVTGDSRAAEGTSWFMARPTNARRVKKAVWTTAGLGVYELYVNGKPVGKDFLKPGFTHNRKTKYAFSYDVTALMDTAAGARNELAAEVSAGWWRDKICSPGTPASEKTGSFAGKKSAFRGTLEVTYEDGTHAAFVTNTRDWRAGVGGPVVQASIFDGETYDARRARPTFEELKTPEVNAEFTGEVLPTAGAEVLLRHDLARKAQEAYVWRAEDVKGADTNAFGTIVRKRTYTADSAMTLEAGEHLVLDFGQNAAAVPYLEMAAEAGTELTIRPAEMLNDGNGAKARGNDGPEGSVYRVNLRANHANCYQARYTFAGKGTERYWPRFTFFGYRYISFEATGKVTISRVLSVPVTSIRKDMERGKIETGSADINRLIANVYWGQLSNYLSVPTDCPQRNERLGWAADTQVFAEAASFNADVYAFLCKWMRDMRDSQAEDGGFPSVAPFAQYGNNIDALGWGDAGVIVPYVMWKQYGDTRILSENWAAMEKYVAHLAARKWETKWQYADWLSYERYEAHGKESPERTAYWSYLGACYWMWDAQMMAEIAAALGKPEAVAKYTQLTADVRAHLRKNHVAADGLLSPIFRDLQTACLFALKLKLVEGAAVEQTKQALKKNIAEHGGCLQTGFLGTSILMDTLTEYGMVDVAYEILFQHKNPSWLYSVDQGATTIWERWNSYRKETGFGPVGMNSFNHYAYGAVLAWIYKTAAGIAADEKAPGFKHIVMAPKPDRRLGHVTASYQTPFGTVESAWAYDAQGTWTWKYTIPAGTTARVTLPDGRTCERGAGTYTDTCR